MVSGGSDTLSRVRLFPVAAIFALAGGFVAACGSFRAAEEMPVGPADAASEAQTADAADAGTADADADAASEVCPSGRGPKMVLVEGTAFRFCVDSTEVTQGQYEKFVTGGGALVTAHPACATKAALGPKPSCLGNEVQYQARAGYPMVCVDFCDALAFCQWAGKRLCGRTGDGGPLVGPDDLGTKPQNEWYLACSQGGTRNYPYGDILRSDVCTLSDPDAGEAGAPRATAPVASDPDCVGSTVPLFDIIGNAREWVNACTPAAGQCGCLGGDGTTLPTGGAARCNDTSGAPPSDQGVRRGIRCCADAR